LTTATRARWVPVAPSTPTRAIRVGRVTARIVGPSLAASYLSLLVLVPVAAVLSRAFDGGIAAMWRNITSPETFASLKLSIVASAIVVAINALAGTAIAWLLVRERFVLNRVIGALVDLPFALPTIVAGVTLLTVFGPGSPIGLNIVYTRTILLLALAFVTLPFSVRSVQPVLEALDVEAEEAAASLGASGFVTFRKIILPSLLPAILTGAGLGFARALGEFGSVVLVSGNFPFKTETATVRIFGLIESDNLPAAAATSLALFVVAIVVLALFAAARKRFVPPEGS
jgi:sulfate transport system permease protein